MGGGCVPRSEQIKLPTEQLHTYLPSPHNASTLPRHLPACLSTWTANRTWGHT